MSAPALPSSPAEGAVQVAAGKEPVILQLQQPLPPEDQQIGSEKPAPIGLAGQPSTLSSAAQPESQPAAAAVPPRSHAPSAADQQPIKVKQEKTGCWAWLSKSCCGSKKKDVPHQPVENKEKEAGDKPPAAEAAVAQQPPASTDKPVAV